MSYDCRVEQKDKSETLKAKSADLSDRSFLLDEKSSELIARADKALETSRKLLARIHFRKEMSPPPAKTGRYSLVVFGQVPELFRQIVCFQPF